MPTHHAKPFACKYRRTVRNTKPWRKPIRGFGYHNNVARREGEELFKWFQTTKEYDPETAFIRLPPQACWDNYYE